MFSGGKPGSDRGLWCDKAGTTGTGTGSPAEEGFLAVGGGGHCPLLGPGNLLGR